MRLVRHVITHLRTRRRLAAVSLGLVLVAAAGALVGGASEARAAQKGVTDYHLERAFPDMAAASSVIAAMDSRGLGARWTRIMVHWDALQPNAPTAAGDGYSETYLTRLESIITELRDGGVKVILTPTGVPRWASNSSLWSSPPHGYKKGAYASFYAMDTSDPEVRAAFRRLGGMLAQRFGLLDVRHFEVWNEPNLGLFLYPQSRRGSAAYGVRVYASMLKEFSRGVKAANSAAVVIAGATAPRGGNDAYSTSPQLFARRLLARKVSSYFSGYSHHPYTPGGSRHGAPDQPPNTPNSTVTLYNLSTLLRMMPSKDFYLTEYGYSTRYSIMFGYTVSEATQARYLKKAFAMLRSKPRVKALVWYLLQDWGPAGHPYDGHGVYTGLVRVNGKHKPAWSTFRALP